MEKEILKNENKKSKALVTSRVLFISVLDKIYLIFLFLMFVGLTSYNFSGNISSISYGFWNRIGLEIIIIVGTFIIYLLMNWFYKCAIKTMLCLTNNEVYKETYIPFKRSESSIPLNKITKVTTCNIFWIFRSIIIHQYHQLPIIFFTWNNQEFKDKLNELITGDKDSIENQYEDKNLIQKEYYKYLKYIGIALAGIIVLIGIVKMFSYIFSFERKVVGTYTNIDNQIVLNKDGNCEIGDLISSVVDCKWTYDKKSQKVEIIYEYNRYYWSGSTDY